MYALYAASAPLGLALNLFAILTCWFWAFLAAAFKLERLPGPLSWVHTHDDNIYGSRMTGEPMPATFLKRWTTAMWWLCRNPGYGFNAYVLGFGGDVSISWVTPEFGASKGGGAWGRTAIMTSQGRRYFSFERHWPLFLGRYAKIWLGWTTNDNGTGRHMLKVMVNPFLSE
jgi:hypothetical protein